MTVNTFFSLILSKYFVNIAEVNVCLAHSERYLKCCNGVFMAIYFLFTGEEFHRIVLKKLIQVS